MNTTPFIIRIMLTAVTIFISHSNLYSTDNTAVISIGNVEAAYGDEAMVPVSADIPGNFHTFQFRIEYNPLVLQFIEFSNYHPNIQGVVSSINNTQGHVSFNFLSFTPVNIPSDTKLFDLVFDFCSDLDACLSEGGESEVSFSTTFLHSVSDFDMFWNPIDYDLLLINGSVSGQGSALYSVTFDLSDNEANPISNAIITLGSITNEEGNYIFSNLEAGQYTYSITAPGYHPASGTIELIDNDLFIDIVLTEAEAPGILYLQDVVISGETVCYDATQSIITAGEGSSFLVEDNANVSLVAGQNIILKAGTSIKAGSIFHAITDPESPFCEKSGIQMVSVINKSNTTQHKNKESSIFLPANQQAASFKVFPNPGRDWFNISVHHADPGSTLDIEVFNIRGERVMKEESSSVHQLRINLESSPPGLYFLRLTINQKTEVVRILKY